MSRRDDEAPAGRAAAGGRAPHAPAAGDAPPGRAAAPIAEPVISPAQTARSGSGAALPPDPAPAGEGATEGAPEARGAGRPDGTEMARARAATAAGRMPGTTHDPNSVTTMTEAEPDGDVYPPPGTREPR